MPHTIVVVACHFAKRDVLCDTTAERLKTALILKNRLDKPSETKFIVTGAEIPYEPGSKTLGELMREYLVEGGIRSDMIMDGKGMGTYDEAKRITHLIAPLRKYRYGPLHYVISSDWYFESGETIWRYFARKRGFPIMCRSILERTGGDITRRRYAIYGTVIRTAAALHILPLVGALFTFLYRNRRNGFTLNGCE